MSAIELRILGTISLSGLSGEEHAAILGRRKRFALLAYLAVATHRGYCSRDTLLGLFWPDLDQTHARGALRQSIHVLRGALGGSSILTAGDDEVRLEPTSIQCDAVAFLAAVAAADFDNALDLYQGDLLSGFFIPNALMFEQWLEEERVCLRTLAARAALQGAAHAEATGLLTLAADRAQRALILNPYSEEVLRLYIRVLASAGDRVQAVRTYDEFAKRVEREWAVLPSPQTRALVSAMRSR